MRLLRFALLLSLSATAPALAGELVVTVDDGHNRPVADAVVSVRSEPGNLPPSPHAPTTKTIDQRNETFVPYVEIFRPGDRVVFRNSDTTRHHVYSFSPTKAFEFVIAPGQSATPVVLDRIGTVSVGCNIHDQMIAYLYVSDAPWVARSGADGRAAFEDLPAGNYSVQVWHPQSRPAQAEPQQSIRMGVAEAALAFSLSLLPDPRDISGDREKSRY